MIETYTPRIVPAPQIIESEHPLIPVTTIDQVHFDTIPVNDSLEVYRDTPTGVIRPDVSYVETALLNSILPNSLYTEEENYKKEARKILRQKIIALEADFITYLRMTTDEAIFKNPLYKGPRRFDLFREAPLTNRVLAKAIKLQREKSNSSNKDIAIVTLDPLLEATLRHVKFGHILAISRERNLENPEIKTGNIVPRPGTKSVSEQLQTITQRQMIVLDDNTESLESLKKTVKITQAAGKEVVGMIAGVQAGKNNTVETNQGILILDPAVKYVKNDDISITIIELRNLILGVTGTTYNNIRVPDIFPFSLSGTADLGDMDLDTMFLLSKLILERTLKFYEELREYGLFFTVKHALPGSQDYLGEAKHGHASDTSMVAITKWALTYLEDNYSEEREKPRIS